MATQLFANNAVTTLNGAITNVATSMVVSSSTPFPAAVTGTSYFYATISDINETVFEIVQVTNVSGTTWTIVRAQDGTTAVAWANAVNVQLRPVAQNFRDVFLAPNTWGAVQTSSATDVFSLGLVLTASASVATAGYLGFNSVQNAHEMNNAQGLKQMIAGTMFTQTATGTNGAATVITALNGTGVGATALPGLFGLVGKTLEIVMTGTVTTTATPGTTVLTLRLNAATPVTIVASPSLTLTASMTNMPFEIRLLLTFRTTTTCIAGGSLTISNSTTGISALVVPIGTTSAATTVAATSYAPQICATNGTASGTIYTSQAMCIKVLN